MRTSMVGAAIVGALCVLGSDAEPAEARAVGGGSAPSLVDCLSRTAGDLFNSCSSTKSVMFPMPVQTTGTKNVTLFGVGIAASDVRCQLVVKSSNNNFSVQTAFQNMQAAGASKIDFPQVTLSNNQFMFSRCDMAGASSVVDIVYND